MVGDRSSMTEHFDRGEEGQGSVQVSVFNTWRKHVYRGGKQNNLLSHDSGAVGVERSVESIRDIAMILFSSRLNDLATCMPRAKKKKKKRARPVSCAQKKST